MVVEAIGGPAMLVDASRRYPTGPDLMLAAALAQGLVQLDAAGQIEPGLAERWSVIDNGNRYIFRLRDARWADGQPVLAGEVAAALRRQLAPGSRNRLAPFLSAVGDVVAMTPEVVEIDLSRPRPDLLRLFADPDLALAHGRSGGAGPYRIAPATNRGLLLRPAPDPVQLDDAPRSSPADDVRLVSDRAAVAVLRFVRGRADLVAGGTIADWPLIAAVDLPGGALRVDPAAGLIGLAIERREGFLADAANRAALASIFDRPALSAAFGGVTPAEAIVPETLDSAAAPVTPDWSGTPLDARRSTARARVAAWVAAQAGTPTRPVLRLALPQGPGGTVLWAHLASALLSIGITPVRVDADAPAELRLVDAVAPYDSARWYLATACRPCGADAQAQLDAARTAPSIAARAQALAAADQAVAADAPFVPLLRPLRWSLVAPRLTGWQPNARAVHPLNHLRDGPG